LAEVLNEVLNKGGRYWPLDKLCLGYLAVVSALIATNWSRIPSAGGLMTLHVVAAACIILAVKLPGRVGWLVHNLYVLPFGGSCYREMATLIPAIRHTMADRWLAGLDLAFWHANPVVWLERLQTPALAEFLQVVYTLFLPVVLLVPFVLWGQHRYKEFHYCAFLLTLGFLASYLGYMMVPARGPRFFLDLQQQPLRGLWLFDSTRDALNQLESAHYDCFPSGHAALTILAWWCTREVSKTMFRLYSVYTLCIIFATVYLQYHYTVDLLGGAVLAWVLILTVPAIYQKLSEPKPSERKLARGGSVGSDIGTD
jgi:membrane-associated phospholipid phosphatase